MFTGSRLPIGTLHAVLDEIGAVDPIYLSTSEKQDAQVEILLARARVEAIALRVLAASEDIAEATGDRSTATWLAARAREAHGTTRRHATLATALDERWTQTADALAAGVVNLAQTRAIVDALDALPQDLGDDRLAKAEVLLVEEAVSLGPRELAVFGSRLWSTSNPTSPTSTSSNDCSPRKPPRMPPRSCRWAAAATVRPTSGPPSPTTPPDDCPPTSTPSPLPAASTPTPTGEGVSPVRMSP